MPLSMMHVGQSAQLARLQQHAEARRTIPMLNASTSRATTGDSSSPPSAVDHPAFLVSSAAGFGDTSWLRSRIQLRYFKATEGEDSLKCRRSPTQPMSDREENKLRMTAT